MSDFRESKRRFFKAFSTVALLSFIPGADAKTFKKAIKRSFASNDFFKNVRELFSLTTDRVYFNNGTVGPSPDAVLNKVIETMKLVEFRSEHRETEGDTARAKIADFIGANKEEISLSHNTSEGINIVAQGLPLKSGDEVIITTHEHVGNALPWLNRARTDGIVLKSFAPPATAAEVVSKIESMITSKTRVITVPHISCTTGQVFPIEEITKLAHSRKILCFVDGAHGAGMLPLSMSAWNIDFYASCGHKWLCGPKGTGFLFVRKDLLDVVDAKFVGAYSDTGWSLENPKINGLAPTAHRYDYGSQNTALYAGLSASIDFFNQIGMQKISDYGRALSTKLHTELSKRPDIEVLTPAEAKSRGMMVSFRFKSADKNFSKFAAFAGKGGFRVRQVPEADLNAIRVSTHLYNSEAEVMKFIDTINDF